jgi:hypothetical protein
MNAFLAKPKFLIPAAVLLVAIIYLMLIHPLSGQLSTLKGDRQATERQLAQATQTAKPSGNAAADGNHKTLEVAVPPTINLSEMLRQLDVIARAAGVRQSTITPAETSALPGNIGSAARITVAANGSRDAIETYLTQLASLDRVFITEQVSIQDAAATSTPGGAAGAGAADVVSGNVQLQLTGRILSTATISTSTTTTPAK